MSEEKELTKREKRELAKQRKKEERRKQDMADNTKKGVLWLVAISIFAFLGWQVYQFFTAPLPEQAVEPIEVAENDNVLGSRDADVVLIEFADFQCPGCKAYSPLIEQLHEDFGDELLIVYRNFPLTTIHKNAMAAALAAEAAARQEKFWEMNKILYERQEEWSGEIAPRDKFISYAEELGMDREVFENDLGSSEVESKVNADILSGNKLDINATPTFFLNGRMVTGIGSYEDFKSKIQAELNN